MFFLKPKFYALYAVGNFAVINPIRHPPDPPSTRPMTGKTQTAPKPNAALVSSTKKFGADPVRQEFSNN
jgi:hypothetical protein